jgi:hypothetical protein
MTTLPNFLSPNPNPNPNFRIDRQLPGTKANKAILLCLANYASTDLQLTQRERRLVNRVLKRGSPSESEGLALVAILDRFGLRVIDVQKIYLPRKWGVS